LEVITNNTIEADFTVLAHLTNKLPFSLAQEQNLLAPGNQNCGFSCPYFRQNMAVM